MFKKPTLVLACMFIFLYALNYLTPMAFGDDYVYSFIWQGHSEYEPLTENAERIKSFEDIYISQWSHYFTWSGRVVSHVIAQFFLWTGKDVFNFFNALISVFLVVEIYWCANKGIITYRFNVKRLICIFFMLWAFTAGFSPVFFWLSGACNYLWPAALLLIFLLPYIRKYYFFQEKINYNIWFKFAMFILGLLSGWTNENSICWIILLLFVFIYVNRNKSGLESWMFTGLAGLTMGYLLLMLAPGNIARLNAEVSTAESVFDPETIKAKLRILGTVFLFQFFLWYFNIRSLFLSKKKALSIRKVENERKLVKAICALAFCMSAIMIFSPNFPPRSSFPGTVQLIIATCILLRIQEESAIELMKENAKKFLVSISSLYFFATSAITFYGFHDYYSQMQERLAIIESLDRTSSEIVTISALVPVSENLYTASGFHLLFYEMTENENEWRNVAFARYYGIKGIRMIKQPVVKDDSKLE